MKDARYLSPKAQEAIRLRAVQAVLNGQSQTQVAQTFGVARGTISRWLKIYREKGEEALLAKPRDDLREESF